MKMNRCNLKTCAIVSKKSPPKPTSIIKWKENTGLKLIKSKSNKNANN